MKMQEKILRGPLSKTEIKILKYLANKADGATVEEIASSVGCSLKGLYFMLRFLHLNGWVRVERMRKGVGRPKNVYVLSKSLDEILCEACGTSEKMDGGRVLNLIGCEYPFSIIRFRRVARNLDYGEILMVCTDDELSRDCMIRMAVQRDLKLVNSVKRGNVFELVFRRR
ncbi:MAG: hypothetical protein ACP5KE_07410 [Candidatus Methanodesulfokora sp.]